MSVLADFHIIKLFKSYEISVEPMNVSHNRHDKHSFVNFVDHYYRPKYCTVKQHTQRSGAPPSLHFDARARKDKPSRSKVAIILDVTTFTFYIYSYMSTWVN